MKENLIIKKYRGSIFLSQDIASDKELIKELSELLGISQATIVEKTPQDPTGKDVIAQKEWNYISPDNCLQINFQAQKIDVEIKNIIENQYQRAVTILSENRDKLDALANKLLEKEVIFREDLEEVFGKRAWDPELTEQPVTHGIANEASTSTEESKGQNSEES